MAFEEFNAEEDRLKAVGGAYAYNIGRNQLSARIKAGIFKSRRPEGTIGEDGDGTEFELKDKTEIEPDHYGQFNGLPALSNVRFFLPNDIDASNEKGFYPDENNSTIIDIPTALMIVNQKRNIIKNIVKGRENSVKEYISDGDFDIQISMKIVSIDPNVYPTAEVALMKEVCQLKSAIRIESDFLEIFGVRSAVVTSYSTPQKVGYYNEQEFVIRLLSDDDNKDLDIIKC